MLRIFNLNSLMGWMVRGLNTSGARFSRPPQTGCGADSLLCNGYWGFFTGH